MSQKKKKEEKDKGVGVTVTPDVKEVIPNRVSEATWEQWGAWDEQSENVADILQMILGLFSYFIRAATTNFMNKSIFIAAMCYFKCSASSDRHLKFTLIYESD